MSALPKDLDARTLRWVADTLDLERSALLEIAGDTTHRYEYRQAVGGTARWIEMRVARLRKLADEIENSPPPASPAEPDMGARDRPLGGGGLFAKGGK